MYSIVETGEVSTGLTRFRIFSIAISFLGLLCSGLNEKENILLTLQKLKLKGEKVSEAPAVSCY